MNRHGIALSGRFLRTENPTGTQRSALRWLHATVPHLRSPLVLYSPLERQKVEFNDTAGLLSYRRLLGQSSYHDHLWEQICFPMMGSASILWTLMGTGPVIHFGRSHVMMVHDINFMLLPDVFSLSFRLWYRWACAEAARRADVVVCFTEYVKGTLIERLRIPGERIRVIPQGPGLNGINITAAPMPSESKYCLCVGSLQPHKNLVSVLRAWKRFVRDRPGWRLVVAGRKQEHFSEVGLEPGLISQPGVAFTGYIDDASLIRLYEGAAFFLYPSLEEGFGLPVIEAFYCGCPVVTSMTSCLPEVAGGAAMLVDPRQPGELLSAMVTLAEQPRERQRLREAGLTRAERFRWGAAGTSMAAVLEEAGA